ncbi:hypothetical protein OL548_14980 [Lysinibacillus sp. MHQ-1]|nr:hypothetical protein OL548_14980 [Lysinibacillus sp. MHQ-1]
MAQHMLRCRGAINAAQDNDTIAVTEDINLSSAISIMKDITLLASGGNYKVTLGINANFRVQDGFDLTLGGGSDTEVLTLSGPQRTIITVANGNIEINNGAKLLATGPRNMVLDLYDPKASGKNNRRTFGIFWINRHFDDEWCQAGGNQWRNYHW